MISPQTTEAMLIHVFCKVISVYLHRCHTMLIYCVCLDNTHTFLYFDNDTYSPKHIWCKEGFKNVNILNLMILVTLCWLSFYMLIICTVFIATNPSDVIPHGLKNVLCFQWVYTFIPLRHLVNIQKEQQQKHTVLHTMLLHYTHSYCTHFLSHRLCFTQTKAAEFSFK